MNNENENKEQPLKKVMEGSVEYREDDHENIIKGAKQEDQLEKLNQGEKAATDDSGSEPVKNVQKDADQP